MVEPRTKEEGITTAGLAGYSLPAEQPDEPKLVEGQESGTLNRAAAGSEFMSLFFESEMPDFRSQ